MGKSRIICLNATRRPKNVRVIFSTERSQWAAALNQLIKYFQTKRGFARKTVPKRGEIDPKHPPKSAFPEGGGAARHKSGVVVR